MTNHNDCVGNKMSGMVLDWIVNFLFFTIFNISRICRNMYVRNMSRKTREGGLKIQTGEKQMLLVFVNGITHLILHCHNPR